MAQQQPQLVLERPYNTKFNGVDGEYGKSASLWLLEVERHREEGSSPSHFLRNIDRQLEGEADRWAKNDPIVRISILKAYGDEATESDIQAFHEAATQRFKLTKEEVLAMAKSWPHYRLACLKQTPSENLEEYYSRAQDILSTLHICDEDYDTLNAAEISLRTMVVVHFVRGLRDDWPTSDTAFQVRLFQQQVLNPRVTLHVAFKMAEAESKKMKLQESAHERKRKLTTDEMESDNAKRQKHVTEALTRLKLRLRTGNPQDKAWEKWMISCPLPQDKETSKGEGAGETV